MAHRGRHGWAKRPKLDERARRKTAPITAHNVGRARKSVRFSEQVAMRVRGWNLERALEADARRRAARERKLGRAA